MASRYEHVVEDLGADPYFRSFPTWSLQETLTGVAIVVSIYLTLVVRILPKFMKNRQPYQLKNTLLVYNVFQVAFSAYLVFIYTRYIIRYNIIVTRCPQGEDLQEVMDETFPYFVAKHLDLLDTVFFALRKKDNQITFLHLFHHTTMLVWTWLHLLYYPTDNLVVVGLLNSFVHVLMYAYYALSSLGPAYSKYIWWKKHLTKVQLIQFILVVLNLHYQQKLAPCPIPAFFHYYCMTLIFTYFGLFMNFYINSYRNKSKKNLTKVQFVNDNLIRAR